jgi:two-component system cell cycle response regulator CtrA
MNYDTNGATIRTGRLVVDLEKRVASVGELSVGLTGKEYGILELLSRRKGMVLTKEMLLSHLYRGTYEPDPKVIDVFICKLRRKIASATGGTHYIETVWGRGYVMREPPTTPAEGGDEFRDSPMR